MVAKCKGPVALWLLAGADFFASGSVLSFSFSWLAAGAALNLGLFRSIRVLGPFALSWVLGEEMRPKAASPPLSLFPLLGEGQGVGIVLRQFFIKRGGVGIAPGAQQNRRNICCAGYHFILIVFAPAVRAVLFQKQTRFLRWAAIPAVPRLPQISPPQSD